MLHNLAGQHAKGRAYREFNRYQAMALMVMLLGGVVIGFALWPFLLHFQVFAAIFVRHGPWISLSLISLATVVVFWLVHWMKGPIESIWKERIRWLRGGQGEVYVACLLRDDLPSGWHIFNNVMIRENWDVDHVVVGPSGLFSISTKAERGFYSRSADGVILFNGKETEYLEEALHLALKFRDRLEALTGRTAPWVQPVLAVPLAHVEFPTRAEKVWVVHEDNLVDALLAGDKYLSRTKVSELVDTLHRCVTNVIVPALKEVPTGHTPAQ
jgi:hypothetical protein